MIDIPAETTVDEGDDVTISCTTDSNPAPFGLQWHRAGHSATLSTSEELSMRGVGRDAAGNYTCKADSRLNISGESVEFVSSLAATYLHVRCEYIESRV